MISITRMRPIALVCAATFIAACRGGGGGTTTGGGKAEPAGPDVVWFEDALASSGIDFVHRSGASGEYHMPESICGGGAVFDFDGDGDLDAYFVQSGDLTDDRSGQPANRLYRNAGDGTFEEVPNAGGADDRGYGMGAACGDFDNDGDVDLYVTNLGANVLYRNDGGTFTDVTAASGTGDVGWGTSAAFFDYDRDGDLDLYVANYVNWLPNAEIECFNSMGTPDYCLPTNYNAPGRDVLYRNDGNGSFTDVTEAAALDSFFGTGLGVLCGDFNGDAYPDVFVANDGMRDQLWANQRNHTFGDIATVLGCGLDESGKAKAGMGVTGQDIDDDGDLDLLVCNLGGESDSLYLNEGRWFTDYTATSGLGAISRPYTRFGMAWLDFDNDGWLDLFQANGRVMRRSQNYSDDPYAEPNVLVRGGQGPKFTAVANAGLAEPLYATSRGAAFGDLDDDGGVDVIVFNKDGAPHVLMNVHPARGNWITLRLVDGGRDALGATVKLRVGSRELTRDARAGYSYLTSNDPRIAVGLGSETQAKAVTVRWTDGAIETFGDLDGGRVVEVVRGEGRPSG